MQNYKQRVLADTRLFQEACRIAIREGLGQNIWEVVSAAQSHPAAFDLDQEEVYGWSEVKNYTEAVRSYLANEADADELETAADIVGYWSDVKDTAKVPQVVEVEVDGGEGDTEYEYRLTIETETRVGRTTYDAGDHVFDDEDDANELAVLSVSDAIADAIMDLATSDEEVEEIAEELGVEPDTYEVYEYYSIEGYQLKKFLENQGELVFHLAGFDVWGRTCTGQAVYIDGWVGDYINSFEDNDPLWEQALDVRTFEVTVSAHGVTYRYVIRCPYTDIEEEVKKLFAEYDSLTWKVFKPDSAVEIKV